MNLHLGHTIHRQFASQFHELRCNRVLHGYAAPTPAWSPVHIHDIWLPNDYPPQWISRHYSEQHLLAAWLLAEGKRMRILLLNAYICTAPALQGALASLWSRPNLRSMHDYESSS